MKMPNLEELVLASAIFNGNRKPFSWKKFKKLLPLGLAALALIGGIVAYKTNKDLKVDAVVAVRYMESEMNGK